MRRLIKSSFLWQFAGGFALGAAGLFVFSATPATAAVTAVSAPAVLAS
jgi:hypothetical protein